MYQGGGHAEIYTFLSRDVTSNRKLTPQKPLHVIGHASCRRKQVGIFLPACVCTVCQYDLICVVNLAGNNTRHTDPQMLCQLGQTGNQQKLALNIVSDDQQERNTPSPTWHIPSTARNASKISFVSFLCVCFECHGLHIPEIEQHQNMEVQPRKGQSSRGKSGNLAIEGMCTCTRTCTCMQMPKKSNVASKLVLQDVILSRGKRSARPNRKCKQTRENAKT